MQLHKLKKFELSRYGFESDQYLREALRRITQSSEVAIHPGLSVLGSEIDSNHRVSYPESSAFLNVSDVTMNFCDLDLEEISRLLRSMRELKSFSYYESGTSYVEISRICEELLRYSHQALQKLCLISNSTKESQIGDFTRFELLAELKVDFVLLVGSMDETCPRLADTLPVSIERVTLTAIVDTDIEALREVASQMIQAKMKRLSKLKALTFDAEQHHDMARDRELSLIEAGLVKKSAEVGILLSVVTHGSS